MASILPKDTEIYFPNFILVSASAGSGKTHALTLRLLQLLLSDGVPNNLLANIIAMTFTKNAASEMKGRLLDYLKKAHLGNEDVLTHLNQVVSSNKEQIQSKAGRIIDEILDNYSDLHIHTIDSFLTRIFKSSALEYGFTPQLEIILEPHSLINEAFDNLISELTKSMEGKSILDNFVNQIVDSQNKDSSFIWNPYLKLRKEITGLFDFLLTRANELAIIQDHSKDLSTIRKNATEIIYEIYKLIGQSGYEPQKWFADIIKSLKDGYIDSVITENFAKSPIKKTSKRLPGMKGTFEDWRTRLVPLQEKLSLQGEIFTIIKAEKYYHPYIKMHDMLLQNLNDIKRREAKVSIGEISKQLATYLRTDTVPEIYYNLGENIYHYLIDEFQDTSPVQWENLRPLLENAVAQNGSLFIVGDTKQSIFTFRGADWTIMKRLMEKQEFSSVETEIRNLDTNYRSTEEILRFNEEVFHNIIPKQIDNKIARASGLSDYEQKVYSKFKGKGFVSYLSFGIDNDNKRERTKLLEIIKDCKNRGFAYRDIAVITPKNSNVVEVSGWLNEEGIDFISHSSLDIRARKLTGEILSLLKFLDSPVDNLSFTNIIIGKIFQRLLNQSDPHVSVNDLHKFIFEYTQSERHKNPLYSSFRSQYPLLWDKYFAELYRLVGYLPVYDIVSTAIKIFRLFELFPEEEATLVKILEVINIFEENGQNSLNDFLSFTEEESDEGEWNVNIPTDLDAVSVMTIHKAKGLGFRVVIVLFYDSRRSNNNLFTEETSDGIKLYRITQTDSERSEVLNEIYLKQRMTEQVDDLNKLYVALTRAKEEMYVLCVKSKYANEPSCYLPQDNYESGQKILIEKTEEKLEQWIEIIHNSTLTLPAPLLGGNLKREERKRGDFIHAVLEQVVEIELNVTAQVESIIQTVENDTLLMDDLSTIKNTIVLFLEQPQIIMWFEKGIDRRVMNEQEFAGSNGQLFRMDRVVIDNDTVTVIDFKTGDAKEIYKEQIDGYKKILKEVFPKKIVQGALAYIDRKEIVWI